MLKIMIVEDEAIERKALRFLINKFYSNSIEIVGEVSNGKDAVIKAEEFKPDIILLDINMPGMNGLEAASIIKDKLKNVEFIILTAFSYFEYAKKAITIGINDYLLKPVSNDEFCLAIDKVILKINEIKKKEYEQSKLMEEAKKIVPFLEKEMIIDMISNSSISETKFNELKSALKIKANYFTCLVISIEDENINKKNILLDIKNNFRYLYDYVIVQAFLDDIICIVFCDEFEKVESKNQLLVLIEDIQKNINSNITSNLKIGIGSIYNNISKLSLSYMQAKIAVKQNDEDISYYSEDKRNDEDNNTTRYPYEKEKHISSLIINENLKGAINEFYSLLNHLTNKEKIDLDTIKKRMYQLCLITDRSIIDFFQHNIDVFSILSIEQDLIKLKNLTEIKMYISDLIKNTVYQISVQKKDRNEMVIEEVKEFIRDNFSKNISLNEAAENIHLSPYYLSKLFKKVEGINFKDYLIKIRIEKAKDLLRKEKKSIKQVAVEVGYSDPNYFSRAFKKYVGVSASEYCKF